MSKIIARNVAVMLLLGAGGYVVTAQAAFVSPLSSIKCSCAPNPYCQCNCNNTGNSCSCTQNGPGC